MICRVRTITDEPSTATLERLWHYTYGSLDLTQPHPHLFLHNHSREHCIQHSLNTVQYWQRRPQGFLVEVSIDDYPVLWFAGEQENLVLTCYLALISPDAHHRRRWMYNSTVYAAVRDQWILLQPATTLRVHTVPQHPPNRLIQLMRRQFDLQWNITHTAQPTCTTIAAYTVLDTVETFDYTWQDLDWQFR